MVTPGTGLCNKTYTDAGFCSVCRRTNHCNGRGRGRAGRQVHGGQGPGPPCGRTHSGIRREGPSAGGAVSGRGRLHHPQAHMDPLRQSSGSRLWVSDSLVAPERGQVQLTAFPDGDPCLPVGPRRRVDQEGTGSPSFFLKGASLPHLREDGDPRPARGQ